MKKLVAVLISATSLIVAMVIPAGANVPTEVSIEVQTNFLGYPGPFVASGPAVESGVICDSGVVIDYSGKVTGVTENGFNFQGIKYFFCDDASGEFFVNIQARIDSTRGVTFHWNVVGGTGDYENLHGAGSGNGIGGEPCGDPDLCVLDIYNGALHIS